MQEAARPRGQEAARPADCRHAVGGGRGEKGESDHTVKNVEQHEDKWR
jgi:hypothetical protein